ncbi:MAG TPA: response regulator [Nitrosopumilaceae archaeon]|nr:response regulator [Nitrosopumilaceae archaeon]
MNKTLKVLIVDDESDIANSIKKFLEGRGFQTDTYIDPQKALEDFKPNFYDLIILDIRMPKMNGFQLYRELMKKDDNSNIFFLTAYEEYRHEFTKAFPELDQRHFIKKPISGTHLMEYLMKEVKINPRL